MKKFFIIAACIVLVLAGTFAILFSQNVGRFKVWFMETTELLLPRPIHIKTPEDVQESFDVWFPSGTEIKDFTVKKNYVPEYEGRQHKRDIICVEVPYRYYLEATIKERYLDDFLAVMRGTRSSYCEIDYALYADEGITLTPNVPDSNTEAADKKIQYQFEGLFSAYKYESVYRGKHYIQVTEPEDGLVTVYCTWFPV